MSATISPCGLYRYTLRREFGAGPSFKTLVFCMLNPSTADADNDDPTIRRCIGFAKREGYTALEVVNLYAYRATSPADLVRAHNLGADVNGPENERHIFETVKASRGPLICGWGANAHPDEEAKMRFLFKEWGVDALCLGKTKGGSPRHPLYVRADKPFEAY